MYSEFHKNLFDRLVDVGVPEFNLAHERLLEIVIDADVILGGAIVSGNAILEDGWNNLSDIVHELIVYTEKHFSEEVDYLRVHGYPSADQHQSKHYDIIEDLNIFQRTVMQHDERKLSDMRRWLLAWLLNHVNNQDQDYADFFSQNIQMEQSSVRPVVIVCVQERLGKRSSCVRGGGEELVKSLDKMFVGQGLDVLVKRSFCFGRCNDGPNIRIAPGGDFYTAMTQERLNEVVSAVRSMVLESDTNS